MVFKVLVLFPFIPLITGYFYYNPYLWFGNPGFQPSFLHLGPFAFNSNSDNFESRFLPFQKQETKLQNIKDECERIKRGSFFDHTGECLKFVQMQVNFAPARKFCQDLGGEIWIPDLNDPDIFAKLLSDIPEVTRAHNEGIWLGMHSVQGKIVTLDGKDVTRTYFGSLSNINNPPGLENGGCAILNFQNNGVTRVEFPCCTNECVADYVCSLKLDEGTSAYKTSIFKRFW